MKYAYSLNDEDYTGDFGTSEEAAEAGADEIYSDTGIWPTCVRVGERIDRKPSDYLSVETILDNAVERACDENGEWATYWMYDLFVPKRVRGQTEAERTQNHKKKYQAELEELQNALGDVFNTWCKKHGHQVTWYSVENFWDQDTPKPLDVIENEQLENNDQTL